MIQELNQPKEEEQKGKFKKPIQEGDRIDGTQIPNGLQISEDLKILRNKTDSTQTVYIERITVPTWLNSYTFLIGSTQNADFTIGLGIHGKQSSRMWKYSLQFGKISVDEYFR